LNSTTVILIALTLALLLVAAFYGLSEAVIDTGSDALDNLSDTVEDDDGNIQFTSTEHSPHYQQIEETERRRMVV